jgi:hypothetical protein
MIDSILSSIYVYLNTYTGSTTSSELLVIFANLIICTVVWMSWEISRKKKQGINPLTAMALLCVTVGSMAYIMAHDGQPRLATVKNPTIYELCKLPQYDLEHRTPDIWNIYCVPLNTLYRQFDEWDRTGHYTK